MNRITSHCSAITNIMALGKWVGQNFIKMLNMFSPSSLIAPRRVLSASKDQIIPTTVLQLYVKANNHVSE